MVQNKWLGMIRVNNHPSITKTFTSKTEATRWANLIEAKLRRGNKMRLAEVNNVGVASLFKKRLKFIIPSPRQLIRGLVVLVYLLK
jgi:hypothetical protein